MVFFVTCVSRRDPDIDRIGELGLKSKDQQMFMASFLSGRAKLVEKNPDSNTVLGYAFMHGRARVKIVVDGDDAEESY